MIKKVLGKIGVGLLVVFILIQFFRPERNMGADVTNQISKTYAVPEGVEQILKTSCYDCHSNSTVYPWYTNIQPVGWWMQHHVNDGKRSLNFSAFSAYRVNRQYDKLEGIMNLVKDEKMPLPSYTLIHTYAKLDKGQKETLINWASAIRDTIKANNPADSLIMPKRPPRP